MKRKYPYLIAAIVLLIFIAIPVFHVLKTYYAEDKPYTTIRSGYTDDASHLNLTEVDSVIDMETDTGAIIRQLREILAYAKVNNKKISIAGARHSMGGHTIYPDGIVLNMRPYNWMELDTTSNILTIGAGALWNEALAYLNRNGRSISVMQAFSSFSIGGSISVNGHGWQHNSPPVSSSVLSFTIMTADGEILECSRDHNKELFSLAIGGYGLFGVILDVKLKVINNTNLTYKAYRFKANEYLSYYKKYADDDSSTQLVFGRLNIAHRNFLNEATLNIFQLSPGRPAPDLAIEADSNSVELKRLIFRSSVNSEYGKKLRWNLETNLSEFISADIYTRNQVLNDDVALVENKDSTTTDILHEYFIPRRNLLSYIEGLNEILPNDKIDLLNITIRNVYPDKDSYMAYAREEVFGFVMLFNQRRNKGDEKEMIKLTNQLTQLAYEMGGTYYLPYRLHVEKYLFTKVYPQNKDFFELKRKYDPEELFQNKFYLRYK